MSVAQTGPHRFRVGIGDASTVDVELDRFDEHTGRILVNGRRFRLVTDTHGPIHLVEVDGVTHRVSRDEGGVLRSPAPALVVATPLQVGDEVEAGAPVLVLESMKMETVLRAPFKARLRECLVSVGSQVETGAPLLRLEPIGDDDRRRGRAERGRRPGAAARADRPVGRGPGRPRHRRPAQPAARLRPRSPRRAPGAVQLPGRPGRARPPSARGRGRAAAGVRRPVRAQPQPAGRRGDQGRHPGAQPARVLPHVPAEPRRRPGRAVGDLPQPARPGADPLRRATTSSARRRWKTPCSGSSSPSNGRRPMSR